MLAKVLVLARVCSTAFKTYPNVLSNRPRFYNHIVISTVSVTGLSLS